MVKRYTKVCGIKDGGCYEVENPDGPYVRHEDYVKLLAIAEEERAELNDEISVNIRLHTEYAALEKLQRGRETGMLAHCDSLNVRIAELEREKAMLLLIHVAVTQAIVEGVITCACGGNGTCDMCRAQDTWYQYCTASQEALKT